jgi:hypothetical protein
VYDSIVVGFVDLQHHKCKISPSSFVRNKVSRKQKKPSRVARGGELTRLIESTRSGLGLCLKRFVFRAKALSFDSLSPPQPDPKHFNLKGFSSSFPSESRALASFAFYGGNKWVFHLTE